jgi:hypothetical protein
MRTWDKYFKFPSYKVDFDHEESKPRVLDSDTPVNKDYAVAETEVYYTDVVDYIEESWRPREKSRVNAMENGKFDACIILFKKAGLFNSIWTKDKFKQQWEKFQKEIENRKKEVKNANSEGKEGQTT